MPDTSELSHRALAPRYVVTLELAVEDAGALWRAAAERALAVPGTTLQDVRDTLGPEEDPAIADCIAMLTAPLAIAGCLAEDFTVVAEMRAAPLRTRALR